MSTDLMMTKHNWLKYILKYLLCANQDSRPFIASGYVSNFFEIFLSVGVRRISFSPIIIYSHIPCRRLMRKKKYGTYFSGSEEAMDEI